MRKTDRCICNVGPAVVPIAGVVASMMPVSPGHLYDQPATAVALMAGRHPMALHAIVAALYFKSLHAEFI